VCTPIPAKSVFGLEKARTLILMERVSQWTMGSSFFTIRIMKLEGNLVNGGEILEGLKSLEKILYTSGNSFELWR
jgi:hypothetical protein